MTFVEAADAWALGPTTFACSACGTEFEHALGHDPDRCPGCDRFPLVRHGIVPPVPRASLVGWTWLGLRAVARRDEPRPPRQVLAEPRTPAAALATAADDFTALEAATDAELTLDAGFDTPAGPLVVGLTRAESRTTIRADLDLARFFGIGRPEDRLTALVDLTVELAARCDAQALGLADRSGPLALCVVHGDRPESDFDRLRAAAHTVDVRGEHLVLHGSRDLLAEPRWSMDLADAVRGL